MRSLLRLSKKFILFILMIVFPISNFAAVSVSDGSSFVSKAEFNSSLNNMSNRIAIIENTLDSKIDNLVSSYLSRNGIWNGDRQVLSSTKYWDVEIPSITLNTNGDSSMSSKLSNNTIISSVSKSGLLVDFIYYTDGKRDQLNQNTSRWGWRITYKGQDFFKTDSGFVLFVNLSEVKSSTESVKYSTIIGSGFSQMYLNYWDSSKGMPSDTSRLSAAIGLSLPASEIIYPVSFFVEKGSSIKISLGIDLHLKSLASVAKMEHAIRYGVQDGFYVY